MEELLKAGTSYDLEEEAQQAIAELLPAKSRERYWKEYDTFLEWRKRKQISEVTENVTIAYFSEKAKHFKSSSLWCQYSMLKKTLMVKENIDISRFLKLKAYVKSRSSGYVPKKSKTFSGDDIEKFLKEAPDKQYLMHRVVMVMGVAGACRCDELHRLTLDDIEEKTEFLFVKIPITKTEKPRSFVVSDAAHVQICKKYLALRPKIIDHKRFFICYRNEKCTVQGAGINTFGKIPTVIAQYLNLPKATKYTGHCFRRTSATLLVDGGGDTLALMRHGGWRSSTVAQGYLEDFLGQKLDAAQKICCGRKRLTTSRPCTSTTDNYEETTPEKVLVVQQPSPAKTSIVKVTSFSENSSVPAHTVEIPSSNNAAPIFVFNSCSTININKV